MTDQLTELRRENTLLRIQQAIEREQADERREVERLERENQELRKQLVRR